MNPTTGTLRLPGCFPTPDFTLRPGQYALVRAQTEVKTNAIAGAAAGGDRIAGRYQVAVVGSDNKAQLQAVKVGSQIGSDWIIEEGLKAGDRVVVEGTQKAKAGHGRESANPAALPAQQPARSPISGH